ncbi:ATP-binding protein [Nucisporomicrobium flavum]|uniref:ATP-binding protein n=1 Tax=Nucisporomicrobium flavum TaxID=2785915 RepID=UPI003C2E403D
MRHQAAARQIRFARSGSSANDAKLPLGGRVRNLSHDTDNDLSTSIRFLFAFPFDRRSLGIVRRELVRHARAGGLDEVAVFNFVLAVNEITTNAVRHGGGRGRIQLWREGSALWCQVKDEGPGITSERLDETLRRKAGHIGGHGIWLARQICGGLHIDTTHGAGTRVLISCELPTTS